MRHRVKTGTMIESATAAGYVHDVFLSYPRRGFVEDWVRQLLLPTLEDELGHVLDRTPRIFIDERIRAGERWPTTLRRALLRSRVLVGVWSAPYFRSRWCLAEWRSMHLRAARTGSRLVLPLVVRDGDCFHEDAKKTQTTDFKACCAPPHALRNTHPDAMRFYREVQRFVEEQVLPAVQSAPAWSPDFPIEMPEPMRPDFDLRRL